MKESVDRLAPVVKEVAVPRPPEEAFRVFTEGLGTWWPFAQYSVSQQRVDHCGMEPRLGGVLYEIRDDGERFVWGTIQAWEPPSRIEFSWHPGRSPETAQTVEILFEKIQSGTRVRLEHRNWEVFGDQAQKARQGYQGGWEHVFCKCFVEAVAAEAEPAPRRG